MVAPRPKWATPSPLETPPNNIVASFIYGCAQRGLREHGPLRHNTGVGWVAPRTGHYADALSRRTKVCLILVESLGGIWGYGDILRLQTPTPHPFQTPNGRPARPQSTALTTAMPPLVLTRLCNTTRNASPAPPLWLMPPPYARKLSASSNRPVF
eukprot:scaffold12600_cov107-Isochrysis_galbana.AAC.7